MFRASLFPSSGAHGYTDGCGMWYVTLWFTGRWSGAGPQVMSFFEHAFYFGRVLEMYEENNIGSYVQQI